MLAERAAPLPSPHPQSRHHWHFLTFRPEHSAAQCWAGSRHSVSRTVFCPTRGLKQLKNAVRSMNSSQGDKSHPVMLHSICFCTEWMNWLQWFNSMPDWQVVELRLNGLILARRSWAGATPPRSIVLSIKAAGSHNWGTSLRTQGDLLAYDKSLNHSSHLKEAYSAFIWILMPWSWTPSRSPPGTSYRSSWN